MDTNGLIDNRNLILWDNLKTIHNIEIHKEKRVDYLAFSKGNKTVIYVPFDNLDSASFTHELLHIYLRTKNVFIGAGLKNSINGNQILSKIFSDNLIEHIGNCLDHIKMLPIFLQLGYDKSEFLSDYSINKLTDENILEIKKYFSVNLLLIKIYKANAIDVFIGKFFAANACPNDSFNYSEQLLKLEKINTDLFQTLYKFLTDWEKFDYNDIDSLTENYHMLLFDFIANLGKWTYGKTII